MLDEETDEKIRRNLVVASTLVLGAAWLVKLDWGKTIDSVVHANPSRGPAAYWTVAFGVLAYLGSRYAFSKAGRQLRRRLEKEFALYRGMAIEAVIRRQMWRYSQGKPTRPMFNGKRLDEIIEPLHQDFLGRQPAAQFSAPQLEFVDVTRHDWTTGYTRFDVWYLEGGGYRGQAIGWNMPWGPGTLAVFLASARIALWSRGSTESIIPVILALAAMASTLYRIVS